MPLHAAPVRAVHASYWSSHRSSWHVCELPWHAFAWRACAGCACIVLVEPQVILTCVWTAWKCLCMPSLCGPCMHRIGQATGHPAMIINIPVDLLLSLSISDSVAIYRREWSWIVELWLKAFLRYLETIIYLFLHLPAEGYEILWERVSSSSFSSSSSSSSSLPCCLSYPIPCRTSLARLWGQWVSPDFICRFAGLRVSVPDRFRSRRTVVLRSYLLPRRTLGVVGVLASIVSK